MERITWGAYVGNLFSSRPLGVLPGMAPPLCLVTVILVPPVTIGVKRSAMIAFDVIGWDLKLGVIPEPSTNTLLIGLYGAAPRRRSAWPRSFSIRTSSPSR
jgi:hypothetical protein